MPDVFCGAGFGFPLLFFAGAFTAEEAVMQDAVIRAGEGFLH